MSDNTSFREYLSELSGECLIERFGSSTRAEMAQSRTRGESSGEAFLEDIQQTYPGMVEAARHVQDVMKRNLDADKMFVEGVLFGSYVMLHMIRLVAEHDEIDSLMKPPKE